MWTWKWKRRRSVVETMIEQPSEATKSRMKAERDLAATRAKTPMYRELGESLRDMRQENNFAPALEALLRGEGR